MPTNPDEQIDALCERLEALHATLKASYRITTNCCPEAAATIRSLREQVKVARQEAATIAEARIAAVRHVIENGYARNPAGNCEHGRNKWEDCIGCYDEALLAALATPEDRDG